MTPTARTLKYLREELGMTAEVVERVNSFTKTRKDLYGFVGARNGQPALAVTWLETE